MSESDGSGVRVERDGAVLHVVLDRPDALNAQTPRTWRALAEVGASVGDSVDDEVRAVVVRGEGSSFSAGLDRAMFAPGGVPGEASLAEVAALDDVAMDAQIAAFQEGFTWLRDPRFVSVALVQGHAIGAGFQLALACDLRLAADDARFCMKEPALGMVPDLTGTKPLVDAVGAARALEICATARTVGAEEALALGLVTAVVPAAELRGAGDDLVGALLSTDPAVLRALTGLVAGAADRDLAAQAAAERRAQAPLLRALASRAAR